jgi:IS4 transposase
MKQKKKNRVKRNLAGKKIQNSVSKKHAKGANEPWLIASSFAPGELSAIEIMRLYRKRMQMEEAFRDLKNTRNGLGLRHCRSYRLEKLNVALLIATLILWLLGTVAKQKNLHYAFQANTEKRWNVLSNFTIGWQVLERGTIKFTPKELAAALENIFAFATWEPSC